MTKNEKQEAMLYCVTCIQAVAVAIEAYRINANRVADPWESVLLIAFEALETKAQELESLITTPDD